MSFSIPNPLSLSLRFYGFSDTDTCVSACIDRVGNEFRSEKIPRNRLGTISVIPRKKVLIPRHAEFRGRANSEARNGTERNGIPRENEVLRNSHGLYDYFDYFHNLHIDKKITLFPTGIERATSPE